MENSVVYQRVFKGYHITIKTHETLGFTWSASKLGHPGNGGASAAQSQKDALKDAKEFVNNRARAGL